MARRRTRKGMRPVSLPRHASVPATGIDRVSCSWRDAVGPGFVVGVTEGVAQVVSPLDSTRYCR
jgi:hypothetical protein